MWAAAAASEQSQSPCWIGSCGSGFGSEDPCTGVNPKAPPVDCAESCCCMAAMKGLEVGDVTCAAGVGVAGVAVFGIGKGRAFNGGLTVPSAYPINPFIWRIEEMVLFHSFQFVVCSLSESVRSVSSVGPPPAPAETDDDIELAIFFSGVVSRFEP